MAARNSSQSRKLWNSMMMFYRRRIIQQGSSSGCTSVTSQGCNSDILASSSNLGSGNYAVNNLGLRFLSSSSGSFQNLDQSKNRISNKEDEGNETPSASKFNLLNWMKWFVGSMLSLMIPFWKQKWESLPGLEGEVEKAVEVVEEAVEVVEKLANLTEKASAIVAENVPENSKVKQAALVVEHACDVIVDDAEQTKKFINKVEDLKQDLKSLETMIEPVIDKIVERGSRANNNLDS